MQSFEVESCVAGASYFVAMPDCAVVNMMRSGDCHADG
jgi:hypothetical protein